MLQATVGDYGQREGRISVSGPLGESLAGGVLHWAGCFCSGSGAGEVACEAGGD